jgi:hypothetical protein
MQALRPSGRTIYFFGALGGLLFGYDRASSPAPCCSSRMTLS